MIFAKLVVVILVWFFALQVWDIATLQLLRVVRSLSALIRFVAGSFIGVGALVLLYVWIPVTARAYSSLAIATFIAALIVEFLVGEDVRRVVRSGLRR